MPALSSAKPYYSRFYFQRASGTAFGITSRYSMQLRLLNLLDRAGPLKFRGSVHGCQKFDAGAGVAVGKTMPPIRSRLHRAALQVHRIRRATCARLSPSSWPPSGSYCMRQDSFAREPFGCQNRNVARSVPPSDSEIRLLLDLLDEAFDKKSWHGPNLRGSIRGVSPEQAAWRPAARRHNIWELTLHAAYWKYVIRRRITGEKRGSFALPGSNFFERPVELTAAAWRRDSGLLAAEHEALRDAVVRLPRQQHDEQKNWPSLLHLIRGAAAHDLYHAGQIRLLRRLQLR